MRTRSLVVALAWAALLLVLTGPALAAPMARILRIDPIAATTDGAPVLTLVVDLVQGSELVDQAGPS